MILVATIQQGIYFAGRLGLGAELVHSKLGKRRRGELIGIFRSGELPCLIATSLADEGLDVPRANVLFLTGAGRSSRAAEQRTGRVLRAFQGKGAATVYDMLDSWHPWLLGQAKARMKVYQRLGYEVRTVGSKGGRVNCEG